ncbi:MAG: diguanylate cyclase [Planctomycetota bacterium]|nr:diguanylate cyclase [Planctomycetota bacterium]
MKRPVDAIGELACPPDELTPNRAVVVVGQDAMPGRHAHTPETPEQFVSSLKLIDPAVRVVSSGESIGGFDGVVDPSDQAAAAYLRSMFEPGRGAMAAPAFTPASAATNEPRPAPKSNANPNVNPSAKASSKPESSQEAAPAKVVVSTAKNAAAKPATPNIASAPVADASIAKAILRGGSPLDAAIARWRLALNEPALNFIASSDLAEGFAVVWEGQRVGTLTGAARSDALMQAAADDIAAWWRVGEQIAQLRAAAFTDALTGAWNRRYFELFTESAMKVAREARRAVTILLFDIDNFKTYNDKYGHDAGDEILREVVQMLRSVIRPTDRVCRIGGDEFVVVFNEPDGPRELSSRHPMHVEQIAHRFQAAVKAHRFPKLANEAPGTLTISGGLATFPWDGVTVADLLRVADERELCSKKHGKNAITLGPGAAD